MIFFNEQKALFHLQGPSYSCILALKDDVLMQLYWGGRLPSDALEGLIHYRGNGASFDSAFSRLPVALPAQEKRALKRPATCHKSAESAETALTRPKKCDIIPTFDDGEE